MKHLFESLEEAECFAAFLVLSNVKFKAYKDGGLVAVEWSGDPDMQQKCQKALESFRNSIKDVKNG